MALPTVSVVIPTYDRRRILAAAVNAATADPYVSEIVVVVDGCEDGSYELLEKLARGDRRIRPLWQENRGASAARETGVEKSSGEVVLLLDDDVVAGPGLAQAHARMHAELSDAVVLGYMPTVLPSTRRPDTFATYLYAEEYEQICSRYETDPSSVLRNLWAGNLSMRRTDALRVGLAGARRLGYHNDQEFGLRCAKAGLIGVFDRSLIAAHQHSRSLPAFARDAWRRGSDRRHLAELFPGELHPEDLCDPMPLPMRFAVRIAATPVGYRLAGPALRAGVRSTGRVRAWALETAFARVLRQVELLRGWHDRP